MTLEEPEFIDLLNLPVQDGVIQISKRLRLELRPQKMKGPWWKCSASSMVDDAKPFENEFRIHHAATLFIGSQSDENLGLSQDVKIEVTEFENDSRDLNFTCAGDDEYSGDLLTEAYAHTLGIAVLRLLTLGQAFEDNILGFRDKVTKPTIYHLGPIHRIPRTILENESVEHELVHGTMNQETLEPSLAFPTLGLKTRFSSMPPGRTLSLDSMGFPYNPETMDEVVILLNLTLAHAMSTLMDDGVFTGNIFIQ